LSTLVVHSYYAFLTFVLGKKVIYLHRKFLYNLKDYMKNICSNIFYKIIKVKKNHDLTIF